MNQYQHPDRNSADFRAVQTVSRSVARRRARRALYGLLVSLGLAGVGASFMPDMDINLAWLTDTNEPELVIDQTQLPAPDATDTADASAPAAETPAAPAVVAQAPAPAVEQPQPVAAAPATPVAAEPQVAAIQQPLTPPAPSPKTYPLAIDLKVRNGDTLLSLLTDAGASEDEARMAVASLKPIYNPHRLDVGQNVSVTLDKPAKTSEGPVISKISMAISPTISVEMKRKGEKFAIKKIQAPLEKRLSRIGGTITSSLYQTGVKNGISPAMLDQIIKAYSYDVDFQRDIHPGNSIDILVERIQTKDGVRVGLGNMVYAELKLDDRVLKIYRYVDKDGTEGFYNEKGESVKKALLRTPINGAHITSGFGMRMHPLLGYSKMHRGVDFGAVTGTPVYAAGDGIVDYASVKGGYGNYLRIKHNANYSTAYAHLSRFASAMRPGQKVKQGQVVAYVGSTGMSTGPHLHYEILANNEQVNPANVKFKGGFPLMGKSLVAFNAVKKKISGTYASLGRGKTEMAQADTTPAAKPSKKSAKN